MVFRSVFVTRYFQLVTKRRFAEAERILERLKIKTKKNEWNDGYLKALSGMLLVWKANDDRYAFLSKLDLHDRKKLQNYRREFLRHSRERFYVDYDRGFFSAWADYTRVLLKMGLNEEKNA